MAIDKQLDNTLNRLNKQLQTARTSFGIASNQYQTLALHAKKALDKYGMITQDRKGTHIKRTTPAINTPEELKEFDKELTRLTIYFENKSNRAARAQYIEDIRKDRLARGETAAQARRRVTFAELHQKANQYADLDDSIHTLIDYLYGERRRVDLKYGRISTNAYKQYFDQVYDIAMSVMHAKHKSPGKIERLLVMTSDLGQKRAILEQLDVTNKADEVTAQLELDKSIHRYTRYKKDVKNLQNKYYIIKPDGNLTKATKPAKQRKKPKSKK